ncbi:MAG: GNAT family N-acetyltransferase [Lewinella sp.]
MYRSNCPTPPFAILADVQPEKVTDLDASMITLRLRPFHIDLDEPTITGWMLDESTRTRMAGMLPLDQFFARVIALPNRKIWLAEVSRRPVGLVDVEIYTDRTASVSLMVDPYQRREGYGHRILRTAMRLKEMQGLKFQAYVASDNVASFACFRKAGFVEHSIGELHDGFHLLEWSAAP